MSELERIDCCIWWKYEADPLMVLETEQNFIRVEIFKNENDELFAKDCDSEHSCRVYQEYNKDNQTFKYRLYSKFLIVRIDKDDKITSLRNSLMKNADLVYQDTEEKDKFKILKYRWTSNQVLEEPVHKSIVALLIKTVIKLHDDTIP